MLYFIWDNRYNNVEYPKNTKTLQRPLKKWQKPKKTGKVN